MVVVLLLVVAGGGCGGGGGGGGVYGRFLWESHGLGESDISL